MSVAEYHALGKKRPDKIYGIQPDDPMSGRVFFIADVPVDRMFSIATGETVYRRNLFILSQSEWGTYSSTNAIANTVWQPADPPTEPYQTPIYKATRHLALQPFTEVTLSVRRDPRDISNTSNSATMATFRDWYSLTESNGRNQTATAMTVNGDSTSSQAGTYTTNSMGVVSAITASISARAKLEYGGQASAYTVAPEDLATNVTATEISVKTDWNLDQYFHSYMYVASEVNHSYTYRFKGGSGRVLVDEIRHISRKEYLSYGKLDPKLVYAIQPEDTNSGEIYFIGEEPIDYVLSDSGLLLYSRNYFSKANGLRGSLDSDGIFTASDLEEGYPITNYLSIPEGGTENSADWIRFQAGSRWPNPNETAVLNQYSRMVLYSPTNTVLQTTTYNSTYNPMTINVGNNNTRYGDRAGATVISYASPMLTLGSLASVSLYTVAPEDIAKDVLVEKKTYTTDGKDYVYWEYVKVEQED